MPDEKESGLPHPSEAMTTPKGKRVFVVVVRTGEYAEDMDTYIAGVYTDREIAEAAAGVEPGAFVIPVPLNLFGRYWKP